MIAVLFFSSSFSSIFFSPSCICIRLCVLWIPMSIRGVCNFRSCSFGPFSSLHGVGFDQGYFLSWAVPIPSTSRAVVQIFERHFTRHYFILPSYFLLSELCILRHPLVFALLFFLFFSYTHTAPPSTHLPPESCFTLSLLCRSRENLLLYY